MPFVFSAKRFMKHRIMLVEDQDELRVLLSESFRAQGCEVIQAPSGAALQASFDGPQPDVALIDLGLPDADGLDLLSALKKRWPETEAIVLTGHGNLDLAVEATKRGAFHFQAKPHTNDLYHLVDRALEHRRRSRPDGQGIDPARTTSSDSAPIFQAAAMRAVLRTIERVAPSDVSVLITGESGTGKEVIADLIHSSSKRAKGPFIKINCAALPRELIESELFGSVKGAFTGALADREGLFRRAEGGTLLLDELSEMPIDTQSKLLRVLQEKEARAVGGRTSYKTDCRVLAATNRYPEQAIKDGKLREDLYYRISAISVALPPLRERPEEILPLAKTFLKHFAAQENRVPLEFSSAALDLLRKHDWPGNVRQLQNEVQRAVLMSDGKQIQVGDFSIFAPDSGAAPAETTLPLLAAMERNKIVEILRETRGNKLAASRRLGIGRQTLYNKITAYSISF